jgi:hypothetical protein
MKVTQDIAARIRVEFGARAAEVLEYLEAEPALDTSSRVLRCVVFLAKGSFDELRIMVGAARADFRDVIFWAEYERHAFERPIHVRDLNEPFSMNRKSK